MTPMAKEFVTPLTLATLTQHAVIIDPFHAESGEWNNHVELGQWADAMIFAPVTANTLGKMAHGIADNFLITAYLSAKCPVFIAPAMDLDMYAHSSTQNSIKILRSFGNIIIEPQVGELASGLSGPGRLEEPEAIRQIIHDHFSHHLDLDKKKILITAGPTHEKIDPVRFIGNYSTGKMGFALASEAALRGGDVTLIAGPTYLQVEDSRIQRIDVESAEEMRTVCMHEAPKADIVIMAAAVADYTFPRKSAVKLKKSSTPFILELKPTPDILKEIGKHKRKKQILVGFALETDDGTASAKKKLVAKNLDFIILNSLKDRGAGFGFETNKISIIDRTGKIYKGKLQNKQVVATEILDFILKKDPFRHDTT
jgi:phosphopantothenoylcysteine decarboxylase / phosphopantothenate---cysteine ligase